MSKIVLMALGVLTLTACIKRAPTSYELDKRSGYAIPPAEPEYEKPKRRKDRKKSVFAESLRMNSTLAPSPIQPARTAPVIQRIWVADQALPDGSWLQGTWLFVEAVPAHWLYEVDPGGGVFVNPGETP